MRLSKRGTLSWATSIKAGPPPAPKMTSTEFRSLCEELNIHDSATAAELFGVSWRTCQRYHYGSVDIPGPLARLLRLAVLRRITHKELRELTKPVD